jgi:hypothetical protein
MNEAALVEALTSSLSPHREIREHAEAALYAV